MITTAYIITTNRCSMRCNYCYERDFFKNNYKDMNVYTLNKCSDFLVSQHDENHFAKPDEHVGMYYFGGEPTLNWQVIKENIEYNKKLEKKYNIKIGLYFLTNGYKIPNDTDFFKVLKNNKVKVQISLDGCKKSHNATRGNFDNIVDNIKLIVKNNCHPIVRMTVTPDNIKYCYDSFSIMSRLSCTVHMTLMPEGNWNLMHEFIARREFKKIMNFYKKANRDKGTKFNISDGICRNGFRACQASRSMVGIDVDGNIYPCHRFVFHNDKEKYNLGNVNEYNGKTINFSNLFSKCESCECTICHPCPSQIILSKLKSAPNNYCRVYKTIQNTCKDVAKQVYDYNKDQIFVNALKLLCKPKEY